MQTKIWYYNQTWHDNWNGEKLMHTFPQLYARDKDTTIATAHEIISADYYDMFHLPMSSIAVEQSIRMQEMIMENISTNSKDTWNFKWASTSYSNRRYIQN